MIRQLGPLGISDEELRSLVIRWLADRTDCQFAHMRSEIAALAVNAGLADRKSAPIGPLDAHLDPKDYSRAQLVIWDLIIEGIVRPGLNDGVTDFLPHFHVTEFGKSRITHEGEVCTPYDPDGYLKRLKATIPGIDPIILTYLEEANKAFRINCLLSSAVTLGCAAEKAMLVLIAAYSDALGEPFATRFRQATDGQTIKRKVDEFNKRLGSHLKGLLSGDLKEDLDTSLGGIFALIRSHRNDAGHPSGKVIERVQAYSNLTLFPSYAKKVYALVQWLGANKPLS